MNSSLFEQIDNAGLIKQGEVNRDAISQLTVFDILEFAQQSVALTDAKALPLEKGLFTHSASLSLGGSRWPCANVECRKRKVEELTQFAAFYSDRVYIHNFLGDHLIHLDRAKYPNEYSLKTKLESDLEVLNTLRPLIEAEIIVPVTLPNYCPHCFATHILKLDSEKRIKKGIQHLVRRYNTEVTFSLELSKRTYVLSFEGPENLIEHGKAAAVFHKPPSGLKKYPQIREQLKSGKKVRLSSKAVRDMKFDTDIPDRIFENVFFEIVASQCLNTKFVTERTIDIEFLRDISANADIDRRNEIVRRHLTCFVPFIGNISTSNILKIRKHEAEAFLLFRKALNAAIDECMQKKNDFSKSDAEGIYQDILRPGLARLDQKVKAAQKSLFRGSAIKILAWTGAITFCLYHSLLPTKLAELAKALGLTTMLANLMENVAVHIDTEKVIQNEDLYFLWKVKPEAAQP